MTRVISALTLAGILLSVACGGNTPAPKTPEPEVTQPAAPEPVRGPRP
jgi:hypothetical protein